MAAKSITVAADIAAVLETLRRQARDNGARIDETPIQNGVRIRISGSTAIGLNVYPSKGGGCKVVFDQPESPAADEIASLLAGKPSVATSKKSSGETIDPALPSEHTWVGSDESGKGDYFGPLVVAAVAVTQENWRVLETLGVQDSKNITDARAAVLSRDLQAFPHEVIVVMPKRYNELWAFFGNVNRLLAWAHARAIENVLEAAPEATAAVADQFGDERLIREALFKRGKQVRLVQMPRAESDPAVAAASILARSEFLRRLDRLSRDGGLRLPKGASSAVEAAARALVAEHGREALSLYAKTHFKTTQRVIQPGML